jgi:hypothetical protein
VVLLAPDLSSLANPASGRGGVACLGLPPQGPENRDIGTSEVSSWSLSVRTGRGSIEFVTGDQEAGVGPGADVMPYWSLYCLYCHGYIADALLECAPTAKRSAAYLLLFHARAGAAFACPYCNSLIGFDESGQPRVPQPGWPVFRYGRAELEVKKQADGEPFPTPLADWALRHRFTGVEALARGSHTASAVVEERSMASAVDNRMRAFVQYG